MSEQQIPWQQCRFQDTMKSAHNVKTPVSRYHPAFHFMTVSGEIQATGNFNTDLIVWWGVDKKHWLNIGSRSTKNLVLIFWICLYVCTFAWVYLLQESISVNTNSSSYTQIGIIKSWNVWHSIIDQVHSLGLNIPGKPTFFFILSNIWLYAN